MTTYSFDRFEVDTDAYELRENGERKHVEPLVFDLIAVFCAAVGRIISREELIDAVWKGRIVSDATISSAVKSMRKALGDTGDEQSFLKTIRGRGFRFDAAIEKTGVETGGSAAATNHAAGSPTAPDILDPSLAILPLQIYGEEPTLGAIADGLVENLTTVLTRIPLLKLSSRMAAASVGDGNVSPGLVRETLGVTYMIEGSIQPVGSDVRVNVQLIETQKGFHLWAQQFDVALDDGAMEGLLHAILPRLEPQLVKAMFKDLGEQGEAMSSRHMLLQAVNLLSLKGWNPDSFQQAAGMLRQVVEAEPDEALGHAYLALILSLGQRVGMFEHEPEILEEASSEAELALELDNLDSNVLGLAGCAFSDAGETDRGIPILQTAIEINPNNAQAHTALGASHMIAGNLALSIEHLTRGIAISPMDPRLGLWGGTLANAYLLSGNLELALAEARKATNTGIKLYFPHLVQAAIHLARNEEEEARKSTKQVFRLAPHLTERHIAAIVGSELASKVSGLHQ